MGELVKSDEIFLEMDRRDQQQIVAAATGDVIGDLMYQVKGKDAISWAGINHICFFMGDIEVDDWVQWDRIEMFGDRVYWCATVRARNVKYNLASLGTAECPELEEIYERDQGNKIPIPGKPGKFKVYLEPDEHCRRKALSKAQRNAKRAVIPEALLKKWLAYFRDKKMGKEVDPPGQPKFVESTQAPPKKKTEKKRAPKKTVKKTEKKPEPVILLHPAKLGGVSVAVEPEPEKKVTPKTQMTIGKVNVNTIDYGLKAAGFGDDIVSVFMEGGAVIVEPVRELTEEEQYQISGAFEGMNPNFEEVGHFGRWKIQEKG